LPAHTDGKLAFFRPASFHEIMPEKFSHMAINMDITIINNVIWWHNCKGIKF
jgi:hypothetical protein